MSAKFAQLFNGGIRYGKNLKVAGADVESGLIVKLDTSGSTASTSGSGAVPFGMAWGNRHRPYTPTTRVFASGEPLTVIQGNGVVGLSADFFDALPSTADQALYTGPGGKWTTSVLGTKVGRFIKTETRQEATGGVGAGQTVYIVRFSFLP